MPETFQDLFQYPDEGENFAVLRHLALNLLKHEQSLTCGIKAKRKMAGWDHDYLLKVQAG